MSRSIKVSETNYHRILNKQWPRESINDVIGRLLNVHDTIESVRDTLGPQHPLVGPWASSETAAKTNEP